jgi:hypothetical protein
VTGTASANSDRLRGEISDNAGLEPACASTTTTVSTTTTATSNN